LHVPLRLFVFLFLFVPAALTVAIFSFFPATDFATSAEGLNEVFAKFAKCKAKGNTPDSDNAQILVKELQNYITNNFYTCTDEILKGLGVMYTADERLKENIDENGSDTAEFVSKAVEIYCKGQT